MKVKKETELFTVLTGSHLYGTATPKSDRDFKTVCLPSMEDLLLNIKLVNRKEKPEGHTPQSSMGADEVETEYLPLQVFFDDFFNGQTYALEMAFAVVQDLHTSPHGEDFRTNVMGRMMNELLDEFLTKNVKKMVGYAVSQSKIYGLKTERFTSLKQAIKLIEDQKAWFDEHTGDMTLSTEFEATKLSFFPSVLDELFTIPYVKKIQLLNGGGGTQMTDGIEVLNKQFPYTTSWGHLLKTLKKTLDSYGNRVADFEGEGTDWKELSHAIRITEEVSDLLSTKFLAFPRPNASFYLDVKLGKIALDEATAYLQEKFSTIDGLVSSSDLRERDEALERKFREWKLKQLRTLYHMQEQSRAAAMY